MCIWDGGRWGGWTSAQVKSLPRPVVPPLPIAAKTLADVKEQRTSILLYENHTTWDKGVTIVDADGHFEFFTDEQSFRARIDQTRKANPAVVEMPQ